MHVSALHRSARARVILSCAAAVFLAASAVAQDWPMANRDMGRSSWTGPNIRFAPPLVKKTPIAVPKGAENITYYRGVLYATAGGYPNTISAIDASTGTVLWWDSVAASVASCDFIPAVAGDVVFAGGQSGRGLYAFDRLSGALRWMKPIGSLYAKSPLVDDSCVTILRDSLWRIDIATGATRWVRKYSSTTSPAIDDHAVYMCLGTAIASADKATGDLLWSIPHTMPSYASIAVAGGVLYASSTDTISAFNAASGAVIWARSLGGKALARLPGNAIAISDSVLCYVYQSDASSKGGIVALDIRDGTQLWSYQYPVAAANPPMIVDGVVYASDWSTGILRVLRLRTGDVIFLDSLAAYEGQPVFGDGILYVAAGHTIVPFVSSGTGAGEPPAPLSPLMIEAAPNPFTTSATIHVMSEPDAVLRVTVFDALGRRVAVLHDGNSSGDIHLRWGGAGEGGALLPSGIYHVVAETSDHAQQAPVVLLR